MFWKIHDSDVIQDNSSKSTNNSIYLKRSL